MPTVSPAKGVLILIRTGNKNLSPLYELLRSDGYSSVTIYLVDNVTDGGGLEMTLERHPEVAVVRISQSLGYCMAYNLAMSYAFADRREWVVRPNEDIRLKPGCLNELVRVARSDSRIGVLGPAFLAWESSGPNYYMFVNHPQAISAMKMRSQTPIDVEWVEGFRLHVPLLFKPFATQLLIAAERLRDA